MFEGASWQSKSNGHIRVILTLGCLVLLVPSLVLLIVSASNENESLMLIALILTSAVIVASAAILIMGRFTDLKWAVANLEFAAAENGLYFTSYAHNGSYFHAEWDEIASYSYITAKDGLTTVTVNFTAPLDAGSYGKLKRLKMVKIADFDKLQKLLIDNNKSGTSLNGK